MRKSLTVSVVALFGLSACSGVSTGVKSPCFGTTPSVSFLAVAPVGQSVEGATNDCNFVDL